MRAALVLGLAAAVVTLAVPVFALTAVLLPGIDEPLRYCDGFCAWPFTRVSKCRCGPVQLPVQPT